MSFQTFLASDKPIAEVENPHIKRMSVNEALQNGVVLPDMVYNSSDINRDKLGVILWCSSEEHFGEIEIRNIEKEYLVCDDRPFSTELPYFSTLEWRYTEERAGKLITFIREHLKQADEIEIWNLWVGYDDIVSKIKKNYVHVDNLTTEDFRKLFYCGQKNNKWQQYDCLSVKRSEAVY